MELLLEDFTRVEPFGVNAVREVYNYHYNAIEATGYWGYLTELASALYAKVFEFTKKFASRTVSKDIMFLYGELLYKVDCCANDVFSEEKLCEYIITYRNQIFTGEEG